MAKTLTNITFLGRAQQVRNQTRIKGQTDMKVIKREWYHKLSPTE